MKTSKILSWLLLTFCLATTANATTYRLQRVTSVMEGNYYVFEQGGYVMGNTFTSSKALKTTSTFSTTRLSRSENYVWTLESVTGGFKMKQGSNYLKNESSTNLSFNTKSNSTTWTFSFQSDGTAIIGASPDKYLGYIDASSHEYKCYSGAGSYGYQPHSIVVYQLVEETGTSAELHFDNTFIKFVKGESYISPVLSKAAGHDGVVTYSSSNSKIATVNATTGEVTIVGTGRVMITASSAATGSYDAGEATYTLMVMGGKGTKSEPYCVSDVNSGYMSLHANVYVKGYVVGYYTSEVLTTTPTDNTNIAIADIRDGATVSDITPLSLASSIQSTYGLKSHPEEMGKLLTAYGSIRYLSLKTSVDNTSSIFFSPTYPVTITSYKYATYRTTEKLDFSGTAVSAYTAEAGTDNVVLTKISDGKVPSGVGVILYSETAGTYDIPVTYDTPTVGNTGLSISNGTDATKENGIYVLGKKNDEVGFYRWVGGASLASGRVYLAPTASSAREYLSFLFDDETAGINNVNVNHNHNDNYYDLQGRHVEHPKRGLYIVNGKKVFIQ
jgi:hypothetical protein